MRSFAPEELEALQARDALDEERFPQPGTFEGDLWDVYRYLRNWGDGMGGLDRATLDAYFVDEGEHLGEVHKAFIRRNIAWLISLDRHVSEVARKRRKELESKR